MEDGNSKHLTKATAGAAGYSQLFLYFFGRFYTQFFLQYFELFPLPSATQKAIMPDFYKAFGQDMQGKAADKLLLCQRYLLFDAVLAIIFVTKSHCFIIHRHDSVVADCDFVRVATQIFQDGGGISKRLFGKDHPVFLP